MKTNNNNNETRNRVNNINDFGQKIGGARKDQYTAAREWAAKLANITADALTAAGGVSKLAKLPNLEKMTEAGAITADQARTVLIIWRSLERMPQRSYMAQRWAHNTRAILEAAAAVLTLQEGEDITAAADKLNSRAADILQTSPDTTTAAILKAAAEVIKTARESAEFAVITAANWPAEVFTFGNYSVKWSYSGLTMRIQTARYYRGEASTDPADIVRQLREMTAADAEKAADRRAAGPALGIFHTSDFTRYYIAVRNKCEINLRTCDTFEEAREAVNNDRAALLARYEDLRKFPALRRDWNRPRKGQKWHAEDVTPEQFAAVLPFKGVEFGNWLNQTERAALLNSAFDGFHDLSALLGIPAAAVTLGGNLNFSFATRGHANSSAHFDSCYNTINLNKRNGAGSMAHEWLHACDHYAAVMAGRGNCASYSAAFATEYKNESNDAATIAARAIIDAIKKTAFYTRSCNYQAIAGTMQGGFAYYTMPCELAARGFEGVVLYLLHKAGGCSDFLVNLQTIETFTENDSDHRRDCYPYPTTNEAAALLPYYIDFFRALFGRCEVSKEAADGIAAATIAANAEKENADRRAAEKAAREKEESDRRKAAQEEEMRKKYEERRAENERRAAEVAAAAENTRAAIVEVMTARHFDNIATNCDAAAVYFIAHLEGEIYTGCADIKTANENGREYVEGLPLARIQYKRVHNAKRVILRRYQVPEIRANKWTAAELCASLGESSIKVREIARTYSDFETVENIAYAAKLYADTIRAREALSKPRTEPTKGNSAPKEGNTRNTTAPAAGLHLEEMAGGVYIIGDDWKDTYFNKKAIKANGGHWNKDAQQWEATDPADVAKLRAWFALREQTTAPTMETEPQSDTADTLQEAGEITDTTNEPAAIVALPEWLKVGAKVRTKSRYMMSTRSTRPQWVEGEEMEITAISADFVSLKSDTARESVSTATAAAELTPIYSASEISQPAESEPAAIAASIDTNEDTADTLQEAGEIKPAATYETSATADEQQQADALPFMEKAAILDKVTARIYAPWGDVSKMWLCPFRGANDVWSAWARNFKANNIGWLADWALTAKAGERAEYRGLMVQIWERDGQTATDPQSEADKLKANRETRERLRAAIVAELETVGAYIYPFNNEMKVFGKIQTAAELSKVEDIARRYSSAQFRHEDRDTVFEFNLPLFFPHFFPTDPTPDPSGEGVAICHSYDTDKPAALQCTGEITDTADPLADIINEAKQQESRTASGLNYGPIEHLRKYILYADSEKTIDENMKNYESNLHRVTDADTYAAYLLSSYDLFVDETQVFCDLRRAFPSLTFAELCQLIRDHMGENQQGDGIAAALVPDCVILSSSDSYTRDTFRERHKKYNRSTADGCTADELRRHYDRESLTLHALLSAELFYLWEDDRAARCLESAREIYPDTTAQELREIRDKYADAVGEIYG